MRITLLVIAAVIFGGAIVVSYSHVYSLMAFAGMSGPIAHLTVIVFEATFIAGTLAYAWGGVPRSVSLSAIVLGLVITLSGNVLDIVGHEILSGTQATLVGVGIGVSIPLSLIVAEFLLKAFLTAGHSTPDVAPVTSKNDNVATAEDVTATMSRQEVTEAGQGPDNVGDTRDTGDSPSDIPRETGDIVGDPGNSGGDTGDIVPMRLGKADRQERVSELASDMSTTELAVLLGVAPKTIQRDLRELGLVAA